MTTDHPLPRVWLAPGAVTDPRALHRFTDLAGIPVCVGPVAAAGGRDRTGATVVHDVGVGGVDHDDAAAIGVPAAEALLGWVGSRRLTACLSLAPGRSGDLATVVDRVRRGLEGGVVRAVEVDLRLADDQAVLKTMARVREAAPRATLLLTRLAVAGDDLVGRARAAVAGGAGAIVVCGQQPLGGRRWWSGPSTLAHTLSGLRLLADATTERRWPGAPVIASGGVHDADSASRAIEAGADGVQAGTALWADPTLLEAIAHGVRDATAGASAPATGTSAPVTGTSAPVHDQNPHDRRSP